jgi:superfamily II DNA or RNA helicase
VLRYYQQEAVDAVFRELQTRKSTLLVLPTGTGKTVCFSEIAKLWPGNVLVLAHRTELVSQAREKLEEMTGEWVDVEQAGFRAMTARLVVASVQTLTRESRLKRFDPSHFSLIIADEAHHYISKTYRKVIEYFTSAKLLGVTATPVRGDGKAMGRIFESVAYQLDIVDAIEAGYLVPIHGHREHLDEIDISDVSSKNGELAAGDLDDAIVKATGAMVSKTVDLYPLARGIFFFPGVKSAQLAANILNEMSPGSAVCVDGETPAAIREKFVGDFKSGKVQFFCNCAIATEGFDVPDIDLVVMGRPTLSLSLYMQMGGRGTRVLPGTVDAMGGADLAFARQLAIASSRKPQLTILDFVGNSGKHSLVSVEDVLGGKYTDDERALAKKKKNPDPMRSLEEARAELRAAQQAAIAVKVKSRTEMFDPFRLRQESGSKFDGKDVRKPSPQMMEALKRIGLDHSELKLITHIQAVKVMRSVAQRRKLGLASYKQLKKLHEFGVTATNIRFETASKAIDVIHASRHINSESVRRLVADVVGHKPREHTASVATPYGR